MNWKIPLFKIYWDDDDLAQVADALKAGMGWAVGANVETFESMIADYIGAKHCVVFNSGTSALHAALLSYGIGPGDEVIVPSFTFIATANAPLFVGAKPVFADIERDTFGLDPDDVQKKITPETKAIIPIHYGGCPCKIKELRTIADENGLLLIEDAAEAFGARVDGAPVGTFGDAAMFSFCQNKVITTGEGGCITTDSEERAQKLRLLRSHGRAEREDHFSSNETGAYVSLGYNMRMSNIIAGLGIAQLKKAEEIIDMRRKNAVYMAQRIEKIAGLTPLGEPEGCRSVHQLYTVYVDDAAKRDGVMAHLKEKGIMSKIYFNPVHHEPLYAKTNGTARLPVTETCARHVLTLPMYPTLSQEEMEYICDTLKNFFEGSV